MAVGSPLPQSSSRSSDSNGLGAKVVEYDRYIETQLHRTRRQVKGVDLAGSLLLLVVASLAYLMAVALVDHWVASGGLGFAGRLAAFALLAAGVLAFAVLRLAPLMLRRVNPVYAAYTIERHQPGIKNSLINFLLLRSGSQRLPERIYEAMEAQAANALSATNTDVAVDRAPVIRWLLAMVAILVCMAFYAVFSPKNPFTSFRRVISPWANVAAPTRVAIEDVTPGDGSGFHDQHVVVSAVIKGLRATEEVTLRYSTRDGQVVDRPLPMALGETGYRHAVELPPDNLGLQQDLQYRIEAGDAISPSYKIRVDTAPTIVLEEIEYKYPDYSELPPRKVARHGDIQALDGTRVTLRAKANQPIGQAHLDFECDGRNDLQMRVEGTRAEVSFALAWNDKTRRAEHQSYQLRFRNEEGHENPKPIRYSIEVVPDLTPEVEFVEPDLDPTKDLLVPPRKAVRLVLEAADPDFKLSSLSFHARHTGSAPINVSLLAAARGGSLRREYLLDLKPLDLKPGEQVEFWASAEDNRRPKANHAETPHYRLRVAAPDEENQRGDNKDENQDKQPGEKGGDADKKQSRGERNEDQQDGNQGQAGEKKKQGGQNSEGQQNEGQGEQQGGGEGSSGGKSQRGESGKKSPAGQGSRNDSGEGDADSAAGANGDGQKRSGQPKQGGEQGEGDKSDQSKRIDPERDAGKAIDEINKFFNQKQKEKQPPNEEQPNQDSQAADGKSGGKSQQQGGKPKDQERESQEDNADNPSQPSDSGGKSGKQSSKKGGGSTGATEQSGSEKQPAGKQPNGKDAGKPTDGKGGRQTDGAKEDKSAEREKKTAKNPEHDPLAPKDKDKNKEASEGERSAKAEQADDAKGGEHEGEKQAGKSGKMHSSGEKGAEGGEEGTRNEGGDKTKKDASGGSKQGEARKGDEGAKHADQETRPRDGQGGQARGAGETDDKMKKHKEESPDQKGGDANSRDKGEGGAGNSEGGNKHGAPETHGGNQGRKKKQLTPDNKKGTTDDEPESSSEMKRQTDSQGAHEGDRDGGGKSGGGQRSNNEGSGTAGQNSEADQGGQQGQTQGEGPTGSKGGKQQKADKPTGGESSGEKGPGTNQGEGQNSDRGIKADSPENADPRGHTNESRQPTEPQTGEKRPPADKQAKAAKQQKRNEQTSQAKKQAEGEPTPSDRGGNEERGGRQSANPTSGGLPGADDQTTTPPPQADDSEPGGEDANQEYARKATDLALQRLKDELAKDKPDRELMDKLNWSREDIERFVEQWDRLRKGADEAGPKGDSARQEFDDALRSLGLRPRGASLTGERKRDDHQRGLRQDRRAAPPPEYQEQWYEYKKSLNKTTKR